MVSKNPTMLDASSYGKVGLWFYNIAFLALCCQGSNHSPDPQDRTLPDQREPAIVLEEVESGVSPQVTVQPTDIKELVLEYEQRKLTREQLRDALRGLQLAYDAHRLDDPIGEAVFLPKGQYTVTGPLKVPANSVLVLDAGVDLLLSEDASIVVNGRLYGLGSYREPIAIHGSKDALYQEISLQGQPSELVYTNFSHGVILLKVQDTENSSIGLRQSQFDYWTEQALAFYSSDGLVVDQCEFGLNTEQTYDRGEAVYGVGSSVVIQQCVFGVARGYRDAIDLSDCVDGHYPIINSNRFTGGEDDAIDLDNCTAIVANNLIENYYPLDLEQKIQGINGGGITGDRYSEPVLINNIIQNCYHGIGFKNGARPIMVHNSILNCNIGVTLYQGVIDAPIPHGILINSLLWNNNNWITDESQTIVLNGKWWPTYNQQDDVQATIEVKHSLLGSAWPGEANRVADPQLIMDSGLPILSVGSPAIDMGTVEPIDFGVFDVSQVRPYLEKDFFGRPRANLSESLTLPDVGAIEWAP